MKRKWMVVIAAVVALPASAARGEEGGDKENLQGAWITTSIESGGRKDDLEVQIEFQGDKIVMTPKGQAAMTGTYQIDPKKLPATMDITLEIGGMKLTIPAIYELKTGEFRLCHPFGEGGVRPGTFEATDKTVLAVLKKKGD